MEVQLNCGLQAFGMSITAGLLAANAANYWVNRYASFVGGSVENRAVGGSGLPSMVSQAYSYMPYSGRTKIAVVDGPLNDIRQAGAAALSSIKPAYDALITTAFSGYVRGPAWTSIVKTGIWSSLGSSYGGRSCFPGFGSLAPMYTTDPTASITFPFAGPTVALHGFASETSDWLDWDIEIDGAPWGATDWTCKARPGAGKQPVALMINGFSAGTHSLKLKPPAGGIPSGRACVIDCVQSPYIGPAPVLLGSIPNIQNWAYGGAVGTWTDAQAANAIIEEVAQEWQARGYPVEFVDITDFIDQTRDFSSDGVHLTDRGHLNWALGYLANTRIRP